jgi:hypothetical protein
MKLKRTSTNCTKQTLSGTRILLCRPWQDQHYIVGTKLSQPGRCQTNYCSLPMELNAITIIRRRPLLSQGQEIGRGQCHARAWRNDAQYVHAIDRMIELGRRLIKSYLIGPFAILCSGVSLQASTNQCTLLQFCFTISFDIVDFFNYVWSFSLFKILDQIYKVISCV